MGVHNELAPTPPMGWNSWNCYGTTIDENDVRATADVMADQLLPFGWEYVVIDAQWYNPHPAGGTYQEHTTFEMDEYGRLWPAPARFPSAARGQGFKPLADALHAQGLKLGIHLMRGIPRQAVAQNTPILGTPYHAQDIADITSTCEWSVDCYGINMEHPGAQAYYDSVAALFAEWGLDYIKADDMISPYHTAEVTGFSQALRTTGAPIVLSLSPGNDSPLQYAQHLQEHCELWRISPDLWDGWQPIKPYLAGLKDQFARCSHWAQYAGPGHWPDADMLPIGRIGPRPPEDADRSTRLTPDEQITMMTLWVMFRSPLMFGGDLLSLDDTTRALLTNDEVLAIQQRSTNNRQLFQHGDSIAWSAEDANGSDRYVALFNIGEQPLTATVASHELDLVGSYALRDMWQRHDLGTQHGTLSAELPPHAARLYRITP